MFNKESLTFIKDFPLLGVYILAVACEALPNPYGYEVEIAFFVGKQRGMSMVCFDNAFVEVLAPGRNSHFGCNRNRQFELR